MARRSNPSLSSILPALLLGGVGAYLLSSSTSPPPSSKPTEVMEKIQGALNRVLFSVDYKWNDARKSLGVPESPYSGLFDVKTSEAYATVGNILFTALQVAGDKLSDRNAYKILPSAGTNILTPDKVLPIVGGNGATQRVSSKFLEWLLANYTGNLSSWEVPAIKYARDLEAEGVKTNPNFVAPDRAALLQAAKQLYPDKFN